MIFTIVGAGLLAIVALALLIAICTDCISDNAKIALGVIGGLLLFALGIVHAIKAAQLIT